MPNTNGYGPKRAILCARVSTDEQARSGYSLAQQIEALRAYAAREGYEVLEEIQDAGYSGASLERPGMDRVRELVAGGGVSVVLAQDLDRISREPWHYEYLRSLIEDNGTELRSLDDSGDDSPMGEFMRYIRRSVAKLEKQDIAKRTRRGKLQKAREAKIVPTRKPPTASATTTPGTASWSSRRRCASSPRSSAWPRKTSVPTPYRTGSEGSAPEPHSAVRRGGGT
jgi:DNA invertase Pin-like site-specific DNA recombinase